MWQFNIIIQVQKRLKSRNNTIVEIRKPIPQLKEVFSRDCLNECIFPLLNLQDLLAFRAVNSHIKINTENYLKTRILQEEKIIAKKIFQSDNLKDFKQYLYEQLPYIEWMMFDQLEIKQILKQNIRDVEKLRKLRTIPQQYDIAFKPYLTLCNLQLKSNYFDNFKKQTNKIQFQEKNVLQAVKEINLLNLQQIRKFSTECYNMIIWCQASICLYLLENIFKVRLPKRQIQFDQLANSYYKQQNIINQAKRIIKAESKFVIFFDFKPQIKIKETKKQKIGYEEMLAYIMQYLDNFVLLRLRLVNQYSNKAVKEILRSNLVICIQNFEVYKLNNQYPSKLMELGFFSPLLDISYTFLQDRQREFIHHNNYDILKIDNLTSQKIQLAFESIYQQKLKSLIVQTSLNKFISKSCNPFNKDPIGIEFCLSSLQQMKQYCKLNPKSQYSFQSVYPLYLHLYLYILINHSIDPCFTIDDEQLQQLFNQCKQLLNILYILGNLKPIDLRDILNESLELLDIDLKQQLASNLNQQFFSIYQIFNQDIDNRDLLYQMATEIVQIYDIESEENFKLNLHMYQELFSNHVMFYLSYQDLAAFAQVNQKAKQLQIMHLRIRTQVESIQIRDFETVNKKTIQEQLQKQFKKDKAFHLIAELQNSDIAELRTIIHPTQIYDHYAQYFILVFDLQGLGNNWNIFLRFLQNPQAYQIFQQFAPETQSSKKIQTIFPILEENLDQIYKANKSLFKLVRWLQGIIQLHCYLRKYSMDSNEITLFKFLDQKQLLIYKAIRYLNNFK